METIDELQQFLAAASADGVRGRLLARAEARAIIRREGQLPADAPAFATGLDVDLSEYGFSLLRASLALREGDGDSESWRLGFRQAANAFESLVRNGAPDAPERGFWRVMGAASYHLAGYSAMAYSLTKQDETEGNYAPAEEALIRLILRDLAGLQDRSRRWLRDEDNSDEAVAAALAEGEMEREDVVALVLTSTIFRAFAFFDFALATGDHRLREEALGLLRGGLDLADAAGAVPLWWITRVSLNVLDDLWRNSLHVTLPPEGPQGGDAYGALRELFLGSLYTRGAAEVELWPSQRGAAVRAVDLFDDLVVALPTSAGKTRIAEITALMSLSAGNRVLIVTPLRALSAQTERSFRRTFAPLGFSVSSLYGASGMPPGDDDALRTRDIVIATPEKLDFALRSDSSLIDDVGLVILDEGHLIGPSERELRFEILVQRLLRREDAGNRRIVCLSAILPDGQQLDDLTSWIRNDAEGDAVKSNWRPTRQRFGMLAWQGQSARLTFDLEDDGPFITRFVEQRPAIRPRRTPFPRDTRELTLAAAWNFAEQGKRTLIFCTQRDHVEGYATTIIDLVSRGFLPSLLDDEESVHRACSIGQEWLGDQHPAVECLKLGVAIHHARLPNPFLREVERLLTDGILKVTVASPTLAQGLNLNAAVLLVPNLYRAGAPLSGEEFANVAGRAGRAFVDLEGLVIHVMYDPVRWRIRAWRDLVNSARSRALESGLIQIVAEVLSRLARGGILARPDALEYLSNNREAWELDVEEEGEEPIESLIEKLDTTILGLIEALDAEAADLPALIDEALNGSLWARQIARKAENVQGHHRAILRARSNVIWSNTTPNQRRGHFAMGVGLDAGLLLDAIADELSELLNTADLAALRGDAEELSAALIELARRILVVRPFCPDDPLPHGWQRVLTAWVSGIEINRIGPDNMRLIEDAFAYRLVWALEAIRTRRAVLGGGAEILEGGAAAALETGLPNLMMAMLVRAGLPSRRAAMAAVNEAEPLFMDNTEMRAWLLSDPVTALTARGDWPTADTAGVWQQFREEMMSGGTQKWEAAQWRRNPDRQTYRLQPQVNTSYRIEVTRNGHVWVCTPDFRRVVRLQRTLRDLKPSILRARFEAGSRQAIVRRIGRSQATWDEPD